MRNFTVTYIIPLCDLSCYQWKDGPASRSPTNTPPRPGKGALAGSKELAVLTTTT
ncbi:MAG: hypothetical protein ACFFCW_38605 [Candidatus Hodarchaeota archaeon]